MVPLVVDDGEEDGAQRGMVRPLPLYSSLQGLTSLSSLSLSVCS